MRRAGELMGRILEPENFRLAFWKAARGKWARSCTRRFAEDLENNLARLRAQLGAGRFPFGQFTCFTVHDPKKRLIHAARFPERVVHHALMNVCEPVFERWLVADSFACRRGKGLLAAIVRAHHFHRSHPWYLQLDIRRYFDSIPHESLLQLLRCRFKDRQVLVIFEQIVRCHQTVPGRGLPIGSLTSQHFANAYLGLLDRFVKEDLRCPAYVRYMDDFVVWANSRQELLKMRARIGSKVCELDFTLKHSGNLNLQAQGLNFLGFRFRGQQVSPNRRSRVRYARKSRLLLRLHHAGYLTQSQIQGRLASMEAFMRLPRHCCFRSAAIGLEPGQPGWLLEQHRAELPLREPQQEQAGQPQQQPRPSSGSGSSSTRVKNATRHEEEPDAVLFPPERYKPSVTGTNPCP